MLPEIGASELLVIAVVALIVVGPKDLPGLLRKLGQWMAKLRGMAAEFRSSFEEMARQSELDELRQQVQALRTGQIEEIAALRANEAQVTEVFQEIGADLKDGMHSPTSYQPPQFESPPALPPPADPPVVTKPPRARAKPKAAAAEAAPPPKAPAKRAAAKPRAKRPGTAA